MKMNEMMETSEEYILHTYNRFPVVLERGEGAYLYDTDGKQYLDFAAGIAVCALGHSNPEYLDALKNQMDRLDACIQPVLQPSYDGSRRKSNRCQRHG